MLLVAIHFWYLFSIINFQESDNWIMEFRNEKISNTQFIWILRILESAFVSRRFKFLRRIKIIKEINIFIDILFLCRKWFKLSFINFGTRCKYRNGCFYWSPFWPIRDRQIIQVWSREPFLVIGCLQMNLFFWISWNGAYYGAYSSNHPNCTFVLLYLTVVKFNVLEIFRDF